MVHPKDKMTFRGAPKTLRILLANLLQRSRSTFSWGSFLSFFAFQEGMLGTQISACEGWPTVSGRFLLPLQIKLSELVS